MFVMDSLKYHLDWAQKNGYKVLYCAPYGSWNYGVADENSDVDSFMIVMPFCANWHLERRLISPNIFYLIMSISLLAICGVLRTICLKGIFVR